MNKNIYTISEKLKVLTYTLSKKICAKLTLPSRPSPLLKNYICAKK